MTGSEKGYDPNDPRFEGFPEEEKAPAKKEGISVDTKAVAAQLKALNLDPKFVGDILTQVAKNKLPSALHSKINEKSVDVVSRMLCQGFAGLKSKTKDALPDDLKGALQVAAKAKMEGLSPDTLGPKQKKVFTAVALGSSAIQLATLPISGPIGAYLTYFAINVAATPGFMAVVLASYFGGPITGVSTFAAVMSKAIAAAPLAKKVMTTAFAGSKIPARKVIDAIGGTVKPLLIKDGKGEKVTDEDIEKAGESITESIPADAVVKKGMRPGVI